MTIWYYTQDGQTHGPVDTGKLKALARSGYVRPADLIWREGLDDWVPAAKAKGLFPSANATSSPSGQQAASQRYAKGQTNSQAPAVNSPTQDTAPKRQSHPTKAAGSSKAKPRAGKFKGLRARLKTAGQATRNEWTILTAERDKTDRESELSKLKRQCGILAASAGDSFEDSAINRTLQEAREMLQSLKSDRGRRKTLVDELESANNSNDTPSLSQLKSEVATLDTRLKTNTRSLERLHHDLGELILTSEKTGGRYDDMRLKKQELERRISETGQRLAELTERREILKNRLGTDIRIVASITVFLTVLAFLGALGFIGVGYVFDATTGEGDIPSHLATVVSSSVDSATTQRFWDKYSGQWGLRRPFPATTQNTHPLFGPPPSDHLYMTVDNEAVSLHKYIAMTYSIQGFPRVDGDRTATTEVSSITVEGEHSARVVINGLDYEVRMSGQEFPIGGVYAATTIRTNPSGEKEAASGYVLPYNNLERTDSDLEVRASGETLRSSDPVHPLAFVPSDIVDRMPDLQKEICDKALEYQKRLVEINRITNPVARMEAERKLEQDQAAWAGDFWQRLSESGGMIRWVGRFSWGKQWAENDRIYISFGNHWAKADKTLTGWSGSELPFAWSGPFFGKSLKSERNWTPEIADWLKDAPMDEVTWVYFTFGTSSGRKGWEERRKHEEVVRPSHRTETIEEWEERRKREEVVRLHPQSWSSRRFISTFIGRRSGRPSSYLGYLGWNLLSIETIER